MPTRYDATIIGAGPNGLAAAIALAQAGRSVVIYEAHEQIGGGCRTADLTLPGFHHDVCSAIHPMAYSSRFLRTLPLEDHGLEWTHPSAPLAHPLDDGSAVILERSVDATAASLDRDATAYRRLMGPLSEHWEELAEGILGPLHIPQHPFVLAHFGLYASRSAAGLARHLFREERAKALLAGMAAHSMLQLEHPPSAAFGLVLGSIAHAVGWPLPRGGSQRIVEALASYFRSLGGQIVTGVEVKSLDQLPETRAILCDITPRQLLRIAGDRLSNGYRQQLRRFRYGPGVCKLDLALDGPIPWKASDCLRAGTVHLGGSLSEIAASERAVWRGEHPERPMVLLAQQSLFDETRAPEGKQTVWAYCHVPNGSTTDVSEKIIAQIARFAPDVQDRILARHVVTASEMEAYNANYVGGDINGGVQDYWQLFTRPTIRPNPYTTSAPELFLCSSSTPPGGGVHGLCGYFAAQSALRGVLS